MGGPGLGRGRVAQGRGSTVSTVVGAVTSAPCLQHSRSSPGERASSEEPSEPGTGVEEGVREERGPGPRRGAEVGVPQARQRWERGGPGGWAEAGMWGSPGRAEVGVWGPRVRAEAGGGGTPGWAEARVCGSPGRAEAGVWGFPGREAGIPGAGWRGPGREGGVRLPGGLGAVLGPALPGVPALSGGGRGRTMAGSGAPRFVRRAAQTAASSGRHGDRTRCLRTPSGLQAGPRVALPGLGALLGRGSYPRQ